MKEQKFLVFNEADKIFAYPDAMTREEGEEFIIEFRARFARQGYYASVEGRIPLSELRLKLIPEGDDE